MARIHPVAALAVPSAAGPAPGVFGGIAQNPLAINTVEIGGC
jgi:hypothetical protein